MDTYRIQNTISGADLGIYEAADEDGALDAMARDAGYADYAAACDEVPVADGEIDVTEIDAEMTISTYTLCTILNCDLPDSWTGDEDAAISINSGTVTVVTDDSGMLSPEWTPTVSMLDAAGYL